MAIFCYYKIKKYADFHVWHPAMKLLWMQININVIFDYHTSCSKIENVRQRVVFQKKWWWSFRKWWYQYAKWNKGLNSNFFDVNWPNRESSTSKKSYQYCFLQEYIPLFPGNDWFKLSGILQLVHVGKFWKNSRKKF